MYYVTMADFAVILGTDLPAGHSGKEVVQLMKGREGAFSVRLPYESPEKQPAKSLWTPSASQRHELLLANMGEQDGLFDAPITEHEEQWYRDNFPEDGE